VLSIGWWKDQRGDPAQSLIDIAGDQPEPSELTPSSGTVVYRLRNWVTFPPLRNEAPPAVDYEVVPVDVVGLIAVRVNADQTMTIEPVPGEQNPSTFTAFSEAKRTYLR
jgi:hypothetical protein